MPDSLTLVESGCLSLLQNETGREQYVVLYHLELKSWLSASTLCKERGGHLPAFRSRGQTKDFIALMLFTFGSIYSEAYYIGRESKVMPPV